MMAGAYCYQVARGDSPHKRLRYFVCKSYDHFEGWGEGIQVTLWGGG
jgi:hypothetical protein